MLSIKITKLRLYACQAVRLSLPPIEWKNKQSEENLKSGFYNISEEDFQIRIRKECWKRIELEVLFKIHVFNVSPNPSNYRDYFTV